jgi:hypothetical protein
MRVRDLFTSRAALMPHDSYVCLPVESRQPRLTSAIDRSEGVSPLLVEFGKNPLAA